MEKKIKILNEYVNNNLNFISKEFITSIENDFNLRFHHDTTSMEGNTYTLNEVKTVLFDKVTISGKSLREFYEVINSKKAYDFIKNNKELGSDINEEFIKDIHSKLMDNILDVGGLYRNTNVRILGASFIPCDYTEVRYEMKRFIEEYNFKKNTLGAIELATWVHAEFVKIHPFIDGNGRCSRLLMNYVLIKNNYLPISINTDYRVEYYNALDEYSITGDYRKFKLLVENLEIIRLNEYKKEIEFNKSNKEKK